MREPALLIASALLLLGASPARAVPIVVDLEDAGPGDVGPLSFTFDMERQPLAPYDFGDIREYSGDHVLKEEDYRINVADHFHAEMAGWTGYGYNWLLEVYPRAFGIYEEYSELWFFASPGRTLVLGGAWTSAWSVGTPLHARLLADPDADPVFSEMRIAGMREAEAPAVPEPASLALFVLGGLGGLGLRALAGASRRRRQG